MFGKKQKTCIFCLICLSWILLLTACGTKTADETQVKVIPETQSSIVVEEHYDPCSLGEKTLEQKTEDELKTQALCYFQNDWQSKEKDFVISANKQNEKFFKVLIDCASAYTDSSTTADEWLKIIDRISELQKEETNSSIATTLLYLSADLLNTKVSEAVAKGRQEYNEKYYDPEIGMTKDQVEKSRWGKPEDVNTTITKYGVHEQWVYYRDKYIYFEDGIVTSIQE
ncbi:hypothetical protein [Paenibacillus sp. R14(2021)]|uniref:hypothetical protein n=1 Tax=Paenibacillus sp. R14(2021) TaxID=2859228 RepID=UPI001C61181C|nr:hypothetical protein [Paenibacillus sp. R14(2021)]